MATSSDWSPAQHYRSTSVPQTVVSAPTPASPDARQAEVERWHEERRERRRNRVRASIWAAFVLCLLGVIVVCGALLLGG